MTSQIMKNFFRYAFQKETQEKMKKEQVLTSMEEISLITTKHKN